MAEINEIKKIYLSENQHEAKIIWKFDRKGNYTVKSGYHTQMETQEQNNANNTNQQED